MYRILALIFLGVLYLPSASARFLVTPTVDLNRPGVLEKLRDSNPAHYEKIGKILDGIMQRPFDDIPRWIQATFATKGVNYSPYALTSYPAQRNLSFVLDGVSYHVRLALTPGGARILERTFP